MCTLMLRHWRAWVRTTCGGSIRRAEGTNNLWSSIQRAEGGCEAGRRWFT